MKDKIDNKSKSSSNLQLIPRDYQIDAYNKLKGKFRTILQLPCGMGKTLISIMLAKDYKKVIIISNLKAHCEQNKSRFEEQMKTYSTLLVESGNGIRDIDKIKKFVNVNQQCSIFSTYKSLDMIIELLQSVNDNSKENDYLIIIDEFHNISYNDIYDNIDSPMYKLLHSKCKIMFMSATPRIYSNNNLSNVDSNIGSEDNEDFEYIDIDNSIL